MSLWDYPIRSDRTCDAAGAPGRNCVDLRNRAGARPTRDDLLCSYCGKPFEQPFEAAPSDDRHRAQRRDATSSDRVGLGRSLVARQDQGAGEEVLQGAPAVIDECRQEAGEEQQNRQGQPSETQEGASQAGW